MVAFGSFILVLKCTWLVKRKIPNEFSNFMWISGNQLNIAAQWHDLYLWHSNLHMKSDILKENSLFQDNILGLQKDFYFFASK